MQPLLIEQPGYPVEDFIEERFREPLEDDAHRSMDGRGIGGVQSQESP